MKVPKGTKGGTDCPIPYPSRVVRPEFPEDKWMLIELNMDGWYYEIMIEPNGEVGIMIDKDGVNEFWYEDPDPNVCAGKISHLIGQDVIEGPVSSTQDESNEST